MFLLGAGVVLALFVGLGEGLVYLGSDPSNVTKVTIWQMLESYRSSSLSFSGNGTIETEWGA
jgi:hypothetical protein